MTPLVFATGWGGYTNFVKFLLKAGADPNIPDAYGKLPVELAAKRDCLEEVEMLFPLTSPIPNIPNWSIDGIISHAKFESAKPLLFNSGSLFDGLSSEMERGNVLKATEWGLIKEDSNVEQLISRADQEEEGKVKLIVDEVDGADLYWVADGEDEKDEKPPRIFVQDPWNSALVEAEGRLRAFGQTCVEDIPRFRINLNDICEKTYRKLMNQIDWWIKELSPLSLSGTPTTPPKVAGIESFYIVDIFEGEGEKMKTVQCLFRTYSLYFGAFRVQIGLNVIPPGWFIFDDEPLPKWIKGIEIPYSVAHGEIDNVELGDFWWPDIFNKFFNFPWNSKVWDSEVSRAIKRVILILAEPKRLRTHQKMVVKTLKPGCTAKIKAEDDIHNWGKRSRESFGLNLNEDVQLPTESDDCYAKTLRKKVLRRSVLYGPRGEILIFKYNEKYVVPIIMKLQEKAALQATRWKPEKDLLDKICGMLDDQFHHKSDAAFRINLNEYRNLNDFNKYLVYILIHKEGTSVQTKLAAGIILKNNMEVAYWKMPSSCRSYIKSQLSPCIGTCNKEIQSVVVKVIATLFQRVRVEGWMDLFQELYECLVSENFYQNEAAIALLLKISENCAGYLDVDILGLPKRPINIFIPMLLKFLKSPKARLRKLSLSCVSQCMALMPSTPCLDLFLDQYLDHLFQLFKDPSSNVRKQVCLSWVQLVELYPSSVEKNLARMNIESWKDREVAISSFGATTDNLGFIVLPLDDNFPLTRSTICRTIFLCSKRIAQGLGHPSGREKFVGMMIALLWKMTDADGKVHETAFYALETLEKEMERKVGGETEARQAFHDHVQLHGVEGWQQLMSALDPAVRQRLQR